MHEITRRDFLKLSGLGLLNFAILPFTNPFAPTLIQQGRVLEASISIYDTPSFKGKKVKEYWKDSLLPITGITIGDEEPSFNRVWYQVAEQGYVHSGVIQPVQTILNEPFTDIPRMGMLAEVTVPYTDAHSGPARSYPVAYRFYYETTHWVLKLVYGPDHDPWYQVWEDKWEGHYFVLARHLRIVSSQELTPISPDTPNAGKRVEVCSAQQVVIAYEWDHPVFVTKVASGAIFSNGNYSTPLGRHITFHKRPTRHMAAGNLAYNGYDLPGVPWITYFTESGISFHGTYWHNNFGQPRSHGCVNMTPKAAKWLYRWTIPAVPPDQMDVYEDFGTIVDVIA